MNNKLKYGIIGILIISSLLIVSAEKLISASRQPNDYFVFIGPFEEIEASQTDDNALDLMYPVYYIPITGGTTYTNALVHLRTTINISQPQQINSLIKDDVVNAAVNRGFNLIKIIRPNYDLVNP